MKQVHMTLQGKGGIGKSLVASLLAQYHLEKNLGVYCINTDPINATFGRYSAYNVLDFDLTERNEVDMAKLDDLMVKLISEDSHFVVDNGVASYLPMCNYLVSFGAVEALTAAGKEIVLHVVICSGQAMLDTLENLTQLARQIPEEVKIVVWLNEYDGPVEVRDGGNIKPFEDMQAYVNHKSRLSGVIRIPEQHSLFSRDIKAMLKAFLTFEEAIASDAFHLMSKQRLTMVRRDIFVQMDSMFAGLNPVNSLKHSKKQAPEAVPLAV